MHDGGRRYGGDKRVDLVWLRQVGPPHVDSATGQRRSGPAIVRGVEVRRCHPATVGEQLLDQCRADEAEGAGDENGIGCGHSVSSLSRRLDLSRLPGAGGLHLVEQFQVIGQAVVHRLVGGVQRLVAEIAPGLGHREVVVPIQTLDREGLQRRLWQAEPEMQPLPRRHRRVYRPAGMRNRGQCSPHASTTGRANSNMLIGSSSLMKYACPGAVPPSTRCSPARMKPCTRLCTYELSRRARRLPISTFTWPVTTRSNTFRNIVWSPGPQMPLGRIAHVSRPPAPFWESTNFSAATLVSVYRSANLSV